MNASVELCMKCLEIPCECGGARANEPRPVGRFDEARRMERDRLASAAQTISSGRGPSGKLRNFKAMGPDKLIDVHNTLRIEGNDREAIVACEGAMRLKGIRFSSAL